MGFVVDVKLRGDGIMEAAKLHTGTILPQLLISFVKSFTLKRLGVLQ
jgi:hypothetical protein